MVTYQKKNNLTDVEVRQAVRDAKVGNYGYATMICRHCLAFWCHPDGKTETAEVVDRLPRGCDCKDKE